MTDLDFITFFDGKVTIEGKTYNFGERNIGYKRHYAARTAGSQISRVIHIPYTRDIQNESLATIGDKTYIIDFAQPTKATNPHCTILTLVDYGVNSNDRR